MSCCKRVMAICLHYEPEAINHDRHFIPLKDGVMDTAISLSCHSLKTGGQGSGFSCHFWWMGNSWVWEDFPVLGISIVLSQTQMHVLENGQHRTWTWIQRDGDKDGGVCVLKEKSPQEKKNWSEFWVFILSWHCPQKLSSSRHVKIKTIMNKSIT